ncbi:MAG: hypothetical protein PVI43_03780, partial [Candidatus Bathyarchaeota archaeon]
MKFGRNSILNIVTAFFSIVFVLASFSQVFGAPVPTDAFIDVVPNPVGVNQQVLICYWIQPSPATASIASGMWQEIAIEVTKPDGYVSTIENLRTDNTGLGSTQYVPDEAGHYSFKMKFPGWTEAGNEYLAAESNIETLIVQGDPVDYEPDDLTCQIPFCDEPCITTTDVLIIIIVIII